MNSSDRKADVELTINEFGNLIFKTSLLILKNKHDAEDATQDVFYKYIVTDNDFANKEHKKAWLLRVCHNICKNMLRYKKIHTYVAYDEIAECIVGSRDIETKEAEEIIKLTNMSYDYKSVIILHYLEGYSVEETANILEITPAAVKKRLQRAREKLKITYDRFFGEGVK
ncbi:RNA polymerase sigma-70 factor, ECF subfamily [Eubacterium uniforme]|uniref:RNA polymerase sigma-70 factor, ECF subfamily n=1 Tax=Eubacterium uniforme TaxID=39495 RepID=A0A1T4W0G2_9FIRM|nr:sigma-70 family RNA polymerase sigma factor [Eubacterium uniforme]SKA70752.1 RNA polymerase sigma-70 factor, ECF subfamily [Eubacterium uniforme]